ncbi:tyrosine-protein kinase transforming protein Src [Capsaspora owczarzaki ATCC 30864]|uniref:TKL protein kinase n=1 Tax=Capsaspora owczarzaki (strain ATCC 30864) TaxID=595528 RepID=A0A0D2WT34_CAPO3|nr:tyrosine-protein kinase transforming protein Src [Capsaspora owczarzaki ATCC 30864]KJE94723.1 TKL protein kinase [Capsaspora owczarzaki ATCC 30864]|eukprot:XP_004347006.1 tyrosine-protein kinase transforming protein Src [Capsaspora owczarzaki ATCC 30864]
MTLRLGARSSAAAARCCGLVLEWGLAAVLFAPDGSNARPVIPDDDQRDQRPHHAPLDSTSGSPGLSPLSSAVREAATGMTGAGWLGLVTAVLVCVALLAVCLESSRRKRNNRTSDSERHLRSPDMRESAQSSSSSSSSSGSTNGRRSRLAYSDLTAQVESARKSAASTSTDAVATAAAAAAVVAATAGSNSKSTDAATALPVPVFLAGAGLIDGEAQTLRRAIELDATLGQGSFGIVQKAFIKRMAVPEHARHLLKPTDDRLPVAIKLLKNDGEATTRNDFIEEANMMAQFRHPNIVLMVAGLLEERPFQIVLEFIAYGDLRSVLVKSRRARIPWTVTEFSHVLAQIASAMEYLGSIRFLHCDLAARNCLVGPNLQVKLSDFGLSRELLDEKNYHRNETKGRLPVKWLAIEALRYRKFTTMSDVWAFGVVAWEVYTYGLVPYGQKRGPEVLAELERGKRLVLPAECPEVIANIVYQCWRDIPEERPDFAALHHVFAISSAMHHIRDMGRTVFSNVAIGKNDE